MVISDQPNGCHRPPSGASFSPSRSFRTPDNISKLGFAVLNWHLAQWGYALIDGKWPTPTILNMGFRLIPRREFLRILAETTGGGGRSGRWCVEAGPKGRIGLEFE